MGYMRHHAIVVSSWNKELLEQAHDQAMTLCASVTEITKETVNGYSSFLVAPDGSKEGWDASDEGDVARAKLVKWLDEQRYDDDSTSLDWVEVQFADDDMHSHIVHDSDDKARIRYADM